MCIFIQQKENEISMTPALVFLMSAAHLCQDFCHNTTLKLSDNLQISWTFWRCSEALMMLAVIFPILGGGIPLFLALDTHFAVLSLVCTYKERPVPAAIQTLLSRSLVTRSEIKYSPCIAHTNWSPKTCV